MTQTMGFRSIVVAAWAILAGGMTPSSSAPAQDSRTESLPSPTLAAIPPHPETLDHARTIAFRTDQRLEARHWSASAAHQSLLAARAEYRPALTLNSSYNLRDNEPAFVFSQPSVAIPAFPNSQRDFSAFHAMASVPLYTSGRLSHAANAAAERARITESEIEISRADLKMQVAEEEYVVVLRTQRELELGECNLRCLEAHTHDAHRFLTGESCVC